jgi:hypothetical protein
MGSFITIDLGYAFLKGHSELCSCTIITTPQLLAIRASNEHMQHCTQSSIGLAL